MLAFNDRTDGADTEICRGPCSEHWRSFCSAGLTLMSRDQGGHLAANRAQLKRACGRLLPYEELSAHVSDDVRGTLDEYGTLLHPGQESRSMLNCALGWEGQSGVHVKAATLVNDLPYEVKTEDLLSPGYEAPGITGRYSDDEGSLWIVAECPKGLTGRVRPASQMYVTVGMGNASIPTGFRILVHVANAITEREHFCSGGEAPMPLILTCSKGSKGSKKAPVGEQVEDVAASVETQDSARCSTTWSTIPLRTHGHGHGCEGRQPALEVPDSALAVARITLLVRAGFVLFSGCQLMPSLDGGLERGCGTGLSPECSPRSQAGRRARADRASPSPAANCPSSA
ncbi:hypothetical protein ACSCB1_13025 [Streptomyces europaeiscabiei]|uniref:hypothetical protein n=1 Tax=Streptomyces europaeiscabiei TaxID=146819 RepID=UPI00131E4BB2|nr:hypothetical protein [Streptomyces europaeiscabiei]MDX2769135.1 hypothetical protein [Streptomyces europaeiscabiei]